jgi:hypothetical protein
MQTVNRETLHQQLLHARDLLLEPSAENLERLEPVLQSAITLLQHELGGRPPIANAGGIARLADQIKLLHEQAGRIRFGVARATAAETAGYTRGGEMRSAPGTPHLEVSG